MSTDRPPLQDLVCQLRGTRGRAFVFSGPSGSGKDTVLRRLAAQGRWPAGLHRITTATTRPPREGEVEGRDYLFLERGEFERRMQAGWFLETAEFAGNLYGTPLPTAEAALAAGQDILLKIEVRGGRQVREALPGAVLVFVMPPSWEALSRRLRQRQTEDAAAFALRTAEAEAEISAAAEYDYIIINDRSVRAALELRNIIQAESCRVRRDHSE